MSLAFKKTNSHRSGLGIRARLFFGFGTITAIFIFAISITLFVITNTKNFTQNVVMRELESRDLLFSLSSQVSHTRSALFLWLITSNVKFKNDFDMSWKNIYRLQNEIDAHQMINTSEQSKLWLELKSLLTSLKNAHTKIGDNSVGASKEATEAGLNEALAISSKIYDLLDGPVNTQGIRAGGLYDLQNEQLKRDTNAMVYGLNQLQVLQLAIAILGIIISFLIAYFTARGILHHINLFREYSSKIASGDLRQNLNIDTNDEIGQLGHDLNTMTESLSSITKQITNACHTIVSTIDEVKQAINMQSSGATEQASSINGITASLEEIEKSSNQTMEKAKALGDAAVRTRERGQQGVEAVEQSILGMKAVREKVQLIAQTILDLSNQTQQVGEITSVVNMLAQQSKMLALNASIEAAKAGEAGKGFAVVASEVKNLAEQSEQSTAQVQKILEDIRHATEKAVMVTEEGTKGVDHGTGLVEKTGEIVRNLNDVIHETTIASQQIEAAIRQEGVGIEQITSGMNEINQVTSSFVASVKQTTEAISHLSGIAKSLKEHVDSYKT